MKFKRFAAALLLVAGFAGIYSFNTDDDVITKINQELEKWAEANPVEKVHLHLDKPYYAAGDDIWFKAYVTIGALHQLSAYSGILNVELINDRDSVTQSLKLQIEEGTAFGDFALADTLHDGNYRIRAYTQYMLNAGRSYIFDRAISIGNAVNNRVFTKVTFDYSSQNNGIEATINYTNIDGTPYANNDVEYSVVLDNDKLVKGKGVTNNDGNLYVTFPGDNKELLNSGRIVTALTIAKGDVVRKSIPVRVMAGKADVQFFPEGGNMIASIPTKIAFKAIGTDGLGIDIQGEIVNGKNTEMTKLSTSHLGMGTFNLTPLAGDSYKASITFPDGSKSVVPLPAVSDNDYVLRVVEAGEDNIRVIVAAAKNAEGQVSIIGQTAGKIYYSAKSISGNGVFSAVIPKNKFPTGIAQFTLFSATGRPLNERLVFIDNPGNKLNLDVTPDEKTYTPRQKVQLNIGATNGAGKPVLSTLSISVTDESKVPANDDSDNSIMANLLLTSDLKGYVEQPAYYFNNANEKTRADLDALMLTQGYRRFEWKAVLNGTQAQNKFTAESTFSISGKVLTPEGKPVVNGKVQIINYEDGMLKIDTTTDKNGRFVFNDMLYSDSVKFYISARTAKNKKDVFITMDTILAPPANQFKNTPDYYLNTGSSINTYAQSSKKLYDEQMKFGLGNHVIKLKEVVIKDKYNPLKHSANINPQLDDQVFVGREIGMGCAKFVDCLKGKLMGVMFFGDKPVSARNGKQMEVFLDGIPIPDPENLFKELNGNDVQAVEVITGAKAAYMGGLAVNGAIMLTTRRGDEPLEGDVYRRIKKSSIYYRPKGAYQARLFYSPMYDAQTNQKLADLRTTIFWKPDILTTDGKAIVNYANAGSAGNYRVVVEGVDEVGNIGRRVYRYKVQ
jgi:hypothetical protein